MTEPDSSSANHQRLESVYFGKDNMVLAAMFAFYAPSARVVVDVCCNARRMWRRVELPGRQICCDRDASVRPDIVSSWDALPFRAESVDVLVYDPPHLPVAAASPKSLPHYGADYGLHGSADANNISSLHPPMLKEATRVLKPDGLVFAKIKDYIHNHAYQWNLHYFCNAVVAEGLTPCDLIIKRDPCGGNLKSGRWKVAHHAKNVHCYWVVVRKGSCEPCGKARGSVFNSGEKGA